MPLDLLEFLTSLKLFFHFVEALLIPLVGPDGYVDPSRFFVILVDVLGNGVSSSPSNSSVQPRMGFPVFTIRDMVNSQHRLLTENLGINHIRAVMGISMGGMQTFQWIQHPSPFGDSLEGAAKQVKAKLTVVAATQDHMVNPTPAMEFAGILHATVVQLTGDCGHLETGCNKAVAAPKVREFIGD